MGILNEDIVRHILVYLWILHNTSWDQEFRPEAHRRYFANYSLISHEWTVTAQKYIYQSVHITWITQWSSFEAGVKSNLRGSTLRASIRILDVSLSNSNLGIPVKLFHTALGYCPHLVELRLRVGPEVNSLYLKSSQETKLQEALIALRRTLRGLQISIDAKRTNSRVMKQIQSLISLDTLDFVTFDWPTDYLDLKMFEGGNWDVRRSVWARVHWPLETNACDLPLSQVLAARTSQIQAQEKKPSASQMPLLVHPSILRVYSYRYEDTPKLVDLLGPYLNTILFQGEFRSVRWTKQCESVVKYCPNLQKLLLLHCFTKGVHSTLHWEVAPVSHLYVLEHQDWHITRTSGSNLGDTNPLPVKLDEVLLESELENAERDLSDGDLVETASHLVIFGEEYCESHTRPVYRKPMVFDKRWPSEAFGAGEETRDAKTLAKGFAHDWSAPLIPLPVNIIVALKQPGTVPTPWDG